MCGYELELGLIQKKPQKAILFAVHSFEELIDAFSQVGMTHGKPLAIIANTVKGKGISFMEGRAEWHNRVPNDEEMAIALTDLGLEP